MTDREKKENEEKKEYLKGYEKILRRMQHHEERIREMRLHQMGGAINYDGMPHAHNISDLSEYVAILDSEERKYMQEQYRRVQKCKEIMDRIERLENEDEKDVLTYRYIRLMKWEDVCKRMEVSWKQVHRLHVRALNNFELPEK